MVVLADSLPPGMRDFALLYNAGPSVGMFSSELGLIADDLAQKKLAPTPTATPPATPSHHESFILVFWCCFDLPAQSSHIRSRPYYVVAVGRLERCRDGWPERPVPRRCPAPCPDLSPAFPILPRTVHRSKIQMAPLGLRDPPHGRTTLAPGLPLVRLPPVMDRSGSTQRRRDHRMPPSPLHLTHRRCQRLALLAVNRGGGGGVDLNRLERACTWVFPATSLRAVRGSACYGSAMSILRFTRPTPNTTDVSRPPRVRRQHGRDNLRSTRPIHSRPPFQPP